MSQSRKKFLRTSAVLASTLLFNPKGLTQNNPDRDQLNPKWVKEFVSAGHNNFDRVKDMLKNYPTLLNAAWDWGGGDFETALGAACHVGYKDLAGFLIENGAQGNIFVACLFGQLEIVKPMVEYFPQLIDAKGPHGFTLLHHAKVGGEGALAVMEYLQSKGADKSKIKLNYPSSKQ